MVDHLVKDLRGEFPGHKFQIVRDYIGRQSDEFFVEPDGVLPDATIKKLQNILARYGDSNKIRPRGDATLVAVENAHTSFV